MSATNGFETALLQHVFQNANLANIGDATGLRSSTTEGSLYIALFTADPTETGSTANECNYTSYARVAVARNSGGFTVSGNNVSNAAAVTFPKATGGSNTATYFAIMTASSGGDMLVSGALNSSLAISNNVQPEFAIGDLDVNVD